MKKSKRHILAIGGALSKSPEAAETLFKYALALSKKAKPRLLFLCTATGDAESTMSWSRRTCANLQAAGIDVEPTFLGFFERTPPDLKTLLLSQDVIFVNGGNTKSMLAVWREYGIDKLLHKAWKRGIVLAGSSAGGICWFDSCLTDSWAESYTSLPCLGILKGSCCPHYDGEVGRQTVYHEMVASGELPDGYAIDEMTGLHFIGRKLHGVVKGVPEGRAFRTTLKKKKKKNSVGDKELAVIAGRA